MKGGWKTLWQLRVFRDVAVVDFRAVKGGWKTLWQLPLKAV